MKTVLITGANKGIGFETARQMLEAGYYVYLGSRDRGKGIAAATQLGSVNIEAIQIDVTDNDSLNEARRHIGEKVKHLDALINNAGIRGEMPQAPSTITPDAVQQVFNTNFFGVLRVTRTFLDLLLKAPAPRIVNVTSGLASLTLHSDPSWIYYNFKGGAYGPSKTALNAYTQALAHELKDTSFRINAVDPGYTATDFNHHQGPGKTSDAAALIAKFATLAPEGPTGKFFSKDLGGAESPW